MPLIETPEFGSDRGFLTINRHSFIVRNPRSEPNSEVSINAISPFRNIFLRNIFSRHPEVVYFAFLWPESSEMITSRGITTKYFITPPSCPFSNNRPHIAVFFNAESIHPHNSGYLGYLACVVL